MKGDKEVIKKIILTICIVVSLFGLGLLGYFLFRPQSIPVLAYHDFDFMENIDPNDENSFFVFPIEDFEKQMKYISDNNYKTISMDEFYSWKKGEYKLPKKSVLITFDDGYKAIYDLVIPIMRKYNLKGTAFVITDTLIEGNSEIKTDYITLDNIKEIQKEYPNFEFHSHTHHLHNRKDGLTFVNSFSEEELEKDIKTVNEFLDTKYIAYPFGSYNDKYISLLKANDYRLGFLYEVPFIRATQKHDDFKIPRITINPGFSLLRFKMILKIGSPTRANIIPK